MFCSSNVALARHSAKGGQARQRAENGGKAQQSRRSSPR